MSSKLMHWLMIGAAATFSFALLSLFAEVFHRHIALFVGLWFFLPATAFWLGSKHVRTSVSVTALTTACVILTCTAAAISFFLFMDYDHVRDFVGKRFVDGYHVAYTEDTDDYG